VAVGHSEASRTTEKFPTKSGKFWDNHLGVGLNVCCKSLALNLIFLTIWQN
jgi:hypothetical protein